MVCQFIQQFLYLCALTFNQTSGLERETGV